MNHLIKSSIPETIRHYPLGNLHLPKRAHNALERAQIFTIGQLLDAGKEDYAKIPQIGVTNISQIKQITTNVLNCLNENGDVAWFRFWELSNIEIIPSHYSIETPTQEIVSSFPKIIESILKHESDERVWIIISRRLGLGGVPTLKLYRARA